MTRRFPAALMGLALLAVPGAIRAQESAALPPPHLSVLEGRAELSRGTDREEAIPNTPLALGDRLATSDGRAEVLLGDGSAVHLDAGTTLDLNGDFVLRLLAGRIIVLTEASAAGQLQIDTEAASIRPRTSGEAHLALLDDRGALTLRVAVVRGQVEVAADSGPIVVSAGQHVFVRAGEAPSYPAAFNSARYDAFVRWSETLVDGRRGATSTQYLPPDVRVYGATFDQYGSWSYAAPYGYVWYPRVAPTWRPYHHGRWRYGRGFGWAFVGYDPWGWATHHYGRWGLSAAGTWFWIPRAGWGAAWVHWAIAPGYVGWSPLGWNNRPVVGFWGHTRVRHGHDPWRAWSVVPAHVFRGGRPVHRERFDPAPFTGPRAPSFVLQPTPPATAIPRGSIVPPTYRIGGPSVEPRAGQSRRGPSVASGSRTTRGGAPVDRGVSATTSSAQVPPATSAAPAAPGSRRAAPPVIYHRGAPIDPRDQTSGAGAYGRAGVAVPRGLPADAPSAGAGPAGVRSASPYDRSTSPYAAPRGRGDRVPPPSAAPPRGGDHPDYRPGYAVPRGDDQRRSGPSGPPPARSYERPPETRQAPAARPPAARSAPRSEPRAAAPPPSRGQGAPPAARSGRDQGSSSGTAVPRRR